MHKDLKMSPGKLAAQVAHCAEAYWTRLIQNHSKPISGTDDYLCCTKIQGGIFTEYLGGAYTKPSVKQETKIIFSKLKLWLRSWGWLRAEILG